ncbi:Gfo/Idh/MocA family oxidoreductase [Streptomyces sp. MP131-18]|uniref:Gfo/Idh/MocA family protein n=1 Tax=Streptomyces sp. MP131-18 TaxID=1857892 RepID=UPI0009CFD99D|nr:Gfo/Idh/MocA family oxidoreductase [Streptomyces sp. MP131-18]ONK09859.1 Inositol 2-dehydrogenase [Streptomyces sp. MP131-18]
MTAPPPFATVPGDEPLRVLLVGAGGMGRAWLRTIAADARVALAGVVDLDPAAARGALAEQPGTEEVPVGTSLGEVAARGGAQAVIDVTVPAAHLPVTLEALDLGLPVLGEKPLAADLAQATVSVKAAEDSGLLFMVSQNRRYDRRLWALKAQAARLGELGLLTQEFFRAPRFGGFRDAMDHPLILDMAVHNFDAARFVLDRDPVAVYCDEYNPPWSWYRGDASATAVFEMAGGVRFVYTGSWCADGLETSWNSRWRLGGSRGSAIWDGEGEPEVEIAHGPAGPGPVAPPLPGEGTAGALTDFVTALRTGRVPMGECHDNLLSLAMVYAAIASSATGARVQVADVLRAARVEAGIPAEVP